MTMHQIRTQERKNKRKSTFYPLFGAEQEGIKRVPHLLLLTYFFCHFIFSFIAVCLVVTGKWGPLLKLNKLEIPSCNSLSNLFLRDANAEKIYVRDLPQ